MALTKFDGLTLPATADFHSHLRDGSMMEAIVPTIREGGTGLCYVMPNLTPPLTDVSSALAYKARLQALEPRVKFLMTLYLHESITPAVVRGAKAAGITGIKCYPAGVTTNSGAGVQSYEKFYPVFEAMQQCGLVLNLHGECQSDHEKDITVLNAEECFLPTLLGLHERFPKLRIVLEHCTTAAAIEAVKKCGPNVVGTITAHHLFLTIDHWASDPFSYCKPVAKLPSDRTALLRAAISGLPKFFLGTDSAPHDVSAKKGKQSQTAAGVFTQNYATQLVLGALEEAVEKGVIKEGEVTEEILKGFLSGHGRKFYGVSDQSGQEIVVSKRGELVQQAVIGKGVEVVPFRSGMETWSLEWK